MRAAAHGCPALCAGRFGLAGSPVRHRHTHAAGALNKRQPNTSPPDDQLHHGRSSDPNNPFGAARRHFPSHAGKAHSGGSGRASFGSSRRRRSRFWHPHSQVRPGCLYTTAGTRNIRIFCRVGCVSYTARSLWQAGIREMMSNSCSRHFRLWAAIRCCFRWRPPPPKTCDVSRRGA